MNETKVKKYYTSDEQNVNTDERSLQSYISTNIPDAEDTIVVAKGMIETRYRKNPIVCFNHITQGIDGKAIAKNRWFKLDEKGILAETIFADTELGNELLYLYKEDFMRGFSVSFIPEIVDLNEMKQLVYKAWTLLEYSCVAIPSNEDAVKRCLDSVTNPDLKEIFQSLYDKNLIQKKFDEFKEDINKRLDENKIVSFDETVLKELQNNYISLQDKFNQLNETLNQVLYREKQNKKAHDFELTIEKALQNKLNNLKI